MRDVHPASAAAGAGLVAIGVVLSICAAASLDVSRIVVVPMLAGAAALVAVAAAAGRS